MCLLLSKSGFSMNSFGCKIVLHSQSPKSSPSRFSSYSSVCCDEVTHCSLLWPGQTITTVLLLRLVATKCACVDQQWWLERRLSRYSVLYFTNDPTNTDTIRHQSSALHILFTKCYLLIITEMNICTSRCTPRQNNVYYPSCYCDWINSLPDCW